MKKYILLIIALLGVQPKAEAVSMPIPTPEAIAFVATGVATGAAFVQLFSTFESDLTVMFDELDRIIEKEEELKKKGKALSRRVFPLTDKIRKINTRILAASNIMLLSAGIAVLAASLK